MFFLSERSKSRMKGIDPRLIKIAEKAITITRVDFGIPATGGVRTAEEQYALYLDGNSKCDGYEKRSKHQPNPADGLGKALDFYAISPKTGKASWNEYDLAMVAAAFLCAACILGYKLTWGGLWKFKDMPHTQLLEK